MPYLPPGQGYSQSQPKEQEPPIKSYNSPDGLLNSLLGPVVVPFVQALISGVFLALAMGAILWAVEAPARSWRFIPVVLFVGVFMWWILYRRRWQYIIEYIWGVDLNRDGFIGVPPKYSNPSTTLSLTVDDRRGGANTLYYLDIPKADVLQKLAPQLIQGANGDKQYTFSYRHYKDYFGDDEFEEYQKLLVELGLLCWRSEKFHQLGTDWTEEGVKTLEHLLRTPTIQPPPPQRTRGLKP